MAAARDRPRVALVRFAHVEQIDLACCETSLEFLDGDRLDLLRSPAHAPPRNVEDADSVQRPRRVQRLVLVGRVDEHWPLRKDERGLRPERAARDRDVHRTGSVTRSERVRGAHVEDDCVLRILHLRERRLRADERPAIEFDDPLHVRRLGRLRSGRCCDEILVALEQRMVVLALVPDRRRRFRAHRGAAKGAGDVSGIHLDAVTELDDPVQRFEHRLRAAARLDGEIRSRRIADEERVAGQNAVGDDKRAVLGAVTRRVQHADDDVAELDLLTVYQWLVRERRLRCRMHAHRDPVLERETAVAGDVVGVRVRLEHGDEPDPVKGTLIQIRLDCVGRIDDDGHTGVLVADEV